MYKMPGIDRIYDKIINDAQQQADSKLYEAALKVDLMRGIIDEKLHDYQHSKYSESENEAKSIISRAEANRNLEGKKQLLKVKQDMISEVFDKAHKALMELEDTKKLSLYAKLINSCLQKGQNEIILNGKDKAGFGSQLIKNIQKDLTSDISVFLSDQDIKDDFGVIVKNGNIYSNSTFASLLKYMKQDLESDVMKILFERGVQA
ncbi:MAG TPA: V-type ATP synthase subunit E [Clostridia bacterium]|nr:V-type ATP synthase subunit E [Clostridia bacterium]